MHQEEIVERVQTALEKALVKSNAARTFTVQTLLPGAQEKINSAKKKAEEGGESPALHVRPAGPPHLLSLRGQSSLLASQVCTLPTA